MYKYPDTCYRTCRLRLAHVGRDRFVAWAQRPAFTERDGRRWQGSPWQFTIAWRNEFFSVTTMFHDGGGLRGHYVNIATPAKLGNRELSFIDLDLDVIVRADLRYEVVDEDEFARHARELGYPQELIDGAQKGLERILERIEQRRSPFDVDGLWNVHELWQR
ncbi:MAG TPA: DUF402 domain-containing protein [Limnochordia bacterium]|nr:DUF402 domain-containing protein [Limnochordia bacterium]